MLEPNNNIAGQNQTEEHEFKFDLINTPWGQRSTKSRVFIVTLLVVIFVAIMACVVNGLVMHYRGFNQFNQASKNIRRSCHLVKADAYPYVARIQSIATQEVVCVGAVVAKNLVLASKFCLARGAIRILVGSFSDPLCRKGFSVGLTESIDIQKDKLVFLTSFEDMSACAVVMPVGTKLNVEARSFVIGKPFHGTKYLTHHPVKVIPDNKTGTIQEEESIISVQELTKCPVQASDLLTQDGSLYGIALDRDENTPSTGNYPFLNLKQVLEMLESKAETVQ
ncbi:uncharacterized protein LOC105398485 [Plutella xylostella]|uniref:uncharacterized protein LOC105398485 n=1 Tax=Plutella xylostella TaxID=51655 RepID=UPI002033097E|nr:uncharacterized protein LOC105398485 [Plutella xylostella]